MNRVDRPRFRAVHALLAAAALLVARAVLAQPCFDVKTFAGRGVGDGGLASAALLSSPRDAALDAAGNIVIADAGNARVRRIDAAGTITTIAGNGAPGIPNDGEPATTASLKQPSGVAVFGQDLFIADIADGANAVWRVTADGVIHRFAGTGVATGSIDGEGGDPHDDLSDGQRAVFATLNLPARVAVDGAGNVFISDFGNNRVRRVDAATGVITTVVAGLAAPIGLALGAGTDLYIANTGTNQILKTSTTGGAAVPFAGTGAVGIAPDNIAPLPAVAAPLNAAAEVAVDAGGVVYIADTKNNVLHSVTPDGLMHRLAGSTGAPGASDGPGFLASFHSPGIALGPGQSLLVPDSDNNRLRRFDPGSPSGTVTTIAGGNNSPGDGGPATAAVLDRPAGLAVDAGGNVLITEHESRRVRRVDPAGTINTIVNKDGLNGPATDGAPAVNSKLEQPTGVTLDGAGNMLIADAQDHRVLLVDQAGIIRTFAGTSSVAGFAGDGGPATSAQLNTPLRMVVASDGTVYIADFNNNRIRKVDPSGTISTFAGNGGELKLPAGLVFDTAGNLYVADYGSNRVLKVDASGAVSLVAGSGTAGNLGDNGPAGAAQLNGPTDVAFATDGSLLVVDQLNSVVRAVARGGDGSVGAGSTITTLFGGTPGFADAAGMLASLLFPTDVAVNAAGNILIADRGNQRVRIATPGNDCVAQLPCASAADCDDHDPCTVDACGTNKFCSHSALPPEQCHPACAAEPAGCIRGGGSARTDCLAEMLVKGLKPGQARPTVRCRDQDSSCDFDATKGVCTFRVAWCFDEPGCNASGVTRFTARGPAAGTILQTVGKMAASRRAGNGILFQTPFTTPSSCSELTTIAVNLRKGGRKPGKLQIRTVAFGNGRGQRDPDRVRLLCLP